MKRTNGVPRVGIFVIGLQTAAVLAIIGILTWGAWQASTATRLLRAQTDRAIDQAAIENAALADVLLRMDATNQAILRALRNIRIDCGQKGRTLTCKLRVPKVRPSSSIVPGPAFGLIPPVPHSTPTTAPPRPRPTLPTGCKIVGKPPHRHIVCPGGGH